MKTLITRFTLVLMLAIMPLSSALAAEDVSYLLTAAAKGDVATVKAVLASGANANVKDEDGLNALMYAARKDNAAVIAALIGGGADINAKDNGGWTALMFAAHYSYSVCLRLLLDVGAAIIEGACKDAVLAADALLEALG